MIDTTYEVRTPNPAELSQVRRLRHIVLDPARVVQSDLSLGHEDFNTENIQAAAFGPIGIVSAVRLDMYTDEFYTVRKMATAVEYRNLGLGARVLAFAEGLAISRGAREFTLGARKEAIGFFLGRGYALTPKEATSPDGVQNYIMKKRVV